MKNLLKETFDKYNIYYTDQQLDFLCQFYQMVIETNKKFNLTAITEEEDFAIKHILDSVLPLKYLKDSASVLDVGAGAGFPSVPLKILRPDLKLTMLDSLNKRVNFLNEVITKLNLSCANAVHSRAEDYAKAHREKFDVVISRAVANLTTLSEYCLPFVKVGGKFIALKGSLLKEELSCAEYAIKTLGGEVEEIQKVFIKEIESERENLIIKKVKSTDVKFPRGKNLPRLKPLTK